MITFIQGDLLQNDAEALVNTVNTVGVMGKGLALQFKEAFPKNYREYQQACSRGEVCVGKMFVTLEEGLFGKRFVVNFPTKTTWKLPSEYAYIESGLTDLRDVIKSLGIKSIAIPPLGSHNGGLDWNRVRPIIVDSLSNLECDVRIFEPSDVIVERLKNERVNLTPARAMMLDVLCDMVAYGEFVSVFAAEKVVYFLQRLGAENVFKIKYEPNFYGPYSGGKICHVLQRLNGSYLQGMRAMNVKPFQPIWILADTRRLVTDYLNNSESMFTEICQRAKNLMRGFYSAASLEMMASLDFILENNSSYAEWRKMEIGDLIYRLENSIREWSSRKEKLFQDHRNIKLVLDQLRNIPENQTTAWT